MSDWRRTPGGTLVITPARFIRFGFARHVASGHVTAWLRYGGQEYRVVSVRVFLDEYEVDAERDVIYLHADGHRHPGVQRFWLYVDDAHEIGIVATDETQHIDALGRIQPKATA
jgi:hypothetical protein